MAETTTNLGKKTVVTTVSTDDRIVLTKSTGALTSITGANLRTYINDGVENSVVYDNILIMYHDGTNENPRMVHLDWWKSTGASKYTATGVVIAEGTKKLVVAPNDSSTTLAWSSAAVTGGGTVVTTRRAAMNDWNGEANTAAQIKHSECSGEDYAPGFCANYSRLNSSGAGYGAGKWWLPSSAELDMIYRHVNGLNYALSLIPGADKIKYGEYIYWSSTEYSGTYAWYQSFYPSYGYLSYGGLKATSKRWVRPVTAYQ
jgi:hypothetical protein